MQVAVTNPFCWPEVRRGGERLQFELCRYLAHQGHKVTLAASAPRADTSKAEAPQGVERLILPRRFDGIGFRHHFGPQHEFYLRARKAFGSLDAETVHALTYFDAAAALDAPRARRPRVQAQIIGVPVSRVFRRVPLDRRLFELSLREADEVFVLSRYARDHLLRDFGVKARVLPPPVDITAFTAKTRPTSDARILFAGDADEPRKGVDLLVQAFAILKLTKREATLLISGRCSPSRRKDLVAGLEPATASAIGFLGVGDASDLPSLYQESTVTVLPSSWEAFGLVLVESLAAGTPVVSTVESGAADIVDRPDVGVLFELASDEPVQALVRALEAALEIATEQSAIQRCRSRAADFSWQTLGPSYAESLH